MTTILLQSADALIGGIAGTATSLAGRAITSVFADTSARDTVRAVQGPRLTEMGGLASQEGAPIPKLYGRARLGGQLVWATRFEEVVNTTTTVERQSAREGGKSLGGSARSATRTTVATTYSYVANLAVGLCEGPIGFVRRIWADGREIDLTTVTMRLHRGSEDQEADPLIVAKEGAENAPAYRGLAYVVFERLPLAPYGNRVPQLSFEVVRPVGSLGPALRSVCLIPGATEFGYDTVPVARLLGLGASEPENVHQLGRATDVQASLDALQALCPNLQHVSVVASWFGDDLRAGSCSIAPRVDLAGKTTSGRDWQVAGLTRAAAVETSRSDGVAAYGGTPADSSVLALVAELKARGLGVTLYPFVMMDIPTGNDLPDPWSGADGQPAYPWRGRITCHPAPGRPGSADGSGEAAAQVASFFGAAAPGHFSIGSGSVAYAGPAEWSLRRLALHYAHLALLAGGVDAFVIGSELVGLTRVRSGPGSYPAAAALRALAADLRTVLGPGTKLTYAADWTEYGAHVRDGGAEVRFPLDPLWADPNIDAVGIDFYPPLSDWRDEPAHLDLGQASGPCDLAYLRGRLASGEAFDWFYAGDAARRDQVRTPITDGAYGKPWIHRAKDLHGWWSHAHVERVGGVEIAATAWSPGAKPIWLTEIGVPAVDKGANAPNVFPDPKSSEGGSPPFSTGARDDLVQARALAAILSRFDPALPGFEPAMNPSATAYAGRMVDPARTSPWCWDARPFPAFPDFDTVWADGANYACGHWLNGRLEGAPLDELVAAILAGFGLESGAMSGLDAFVDGYVVDRPMSARAALEPLAGLYGIDVAASGSGLAWRGRGGAVAAVLDEEDLVLAEKAPLLSRTRAQETELPASIELGFTDGEGEYGRAATGSRRLAGSSRRELALDVAVVARRDEAQRLADIHLQDLWAGRDTAEAAISPRALATEPGDILDVRAEGAERLYRVTRIVDGSARSLSLRAVEPALFQVPAGGRAGERRRRSPPSVPGPPFAVALDLPATGRVPETLQHLAVAADPWPGAVAIWRAAPGDDGYALHQLAEVPALIGRTSSGFPSGPVWRWDRRATLDVELSGGSLSSLSEEETLAGGNLLALLGPDGAAEIVGARSATLIGPRRYRLSGFLRGLGGTERLAGRSLAPGAAAARLDGAPAPLATALGEIGRGWTYRVGPADRDHADPGYVTLTATVPTSALLPLAPVHARARRGGAGIAISWIRRTRLDGDSWDLAEVPLAEESEAYAVDILAGDTPVRTLASTQPSVLYAAADESADFGAPQASLALRVAQVSRTVGRGRDLAVTLPIS